MRATLTLRYLMVYIGSFWLNLEAQLCAIRWDNNNDQTRTPNAKAGPKAKPKVTSEFYHLFRREAHLSQEARERLIGAWPGEGVVHGRRAAYEDEHGFRWQR